VKSPLLFDILGVAKNLIKSRRKGYDAYYQTLSGTTRSKTAAG
jgi:hypothetical protein